MISITEVTQQVNTYSKQYPNESEKLAPLKMYLADEQPSLIDRKNFNGHLTSSAFIVNATFDSLLLIHHKTLNKWLQPGGHIDATDATLVAAGLREAAEETGISVTDLQYLPINDAQPELPFDIDPHMIPQNDRKGEPAHYHHDHRFVFSYSGTGALQRCVEETNDIRWFSFSELENDKLFGYVIKKLLAVPKFSGK